ncbi:phage baseplate protein [Bacillus sp. SL00103]
MRQRGNIDGEARKIKIVNEKESDNPEIDVTSYSCGKGIPITDHVQRKPEITSLGFCRAKIQTKTCVS